MAGNNIMDLADLNIQPKKNRPDPKPLLDMVMGFQKSQIIFTATNLGIFEELSRSAKPLTASQVANKLQLNADATSRLMNGCVTLGLLAVAKQNDKTLTYNCTPTTNMFLVKSSRMSLRPLVQQVGDMYKLWDRMPEAVRDGQCQLTAALGLNGDFFEEGEGFYTSENKQIEFLQTMHMFSKQDCPHILKHIDLKQYSTACDLGGGTGAIAKEIALKYPKTQVSVLELPHVVRVAEHFQDTVNPPNFHFIEGNFFNDHLPQADLYILSHVIHDWSPDKVDLILRKVYDSLDKGGAVLILEKILNESKTGPPSSVMLDLNMLVGCEGKERSGEEYRSLLKQHGFNSVQVIPIPMAMHRDAILAKKL